MFQVSSELYDEIAIRLREAFGGGGFYSGSVECAVGETLCRLTASLVLYRSDDGRGSRVVGIPYRDSRRGGAQRFFVRRTAAQPARVVSSAKVAVPAPGATAPDLRLRCRVLVRPARTGVRPAR